MSGEERRGGRGNTFSEEEIRVNIGEMKRPQGFANASKALTPPEDGSLSER